MNTGPDERHPAAHAASVLRVAALQMVSTPRVDENLRTAAALIGEAVAQGAELLALPEYFAIMGMTDADKVRLRESDGRGPIQDFLAGSAREHAVWLIGGSLPLLADSPDKVLNSTLVYDPQGRRVARYDKIHLFGFQQGSERYDESATIEAGRLPTAFVTPFGRVGLSICYDLRFPELYRALGVTELIVVPAAFTETTGRAHWEILLRARAIENQCYVLAVAQGGRHENGRETHGNSMLIDPWGTILDRKQKGPGIVIGDLEQVRLAEVRASLPALAHRVM
ncbi:MAG TPA: carbon-nitrogen hydrolase family protein [Candidatus Accumulibacter phosphatis]|nr:acyltransferase [Accumulibacter sp.]HCN67946.1 acyltransferase [Accumulibacter sp.]HRL77070.1 carbon-nitrogen hydrolase family protein [Candidatus Accumulibacter phosphatis]HRQ96664.1 carbon-nitrogen hydrolase family protein [Candidatus Accumulibacter phosphatis]